MSTRRRVPTNWLSGRALQPSIESVVANSFVPSDFLVDGQVSGLGTAHPLLTLSFFSTWILPLHVVVVEEEVVVIRNGYAPKKKKKEESWKNLPNRCRPLRGWKTRPEKERRGRPNRHHSIPAPRERGLIQPFFR